MRLFQRVGSMAVVVGLLSSPATGLTITNQDSSDHTVTVSANGKNTDHKIAPGRVLEIACVVGCRLHLRGAVGATNGAVDDDFIIKGGKLASKYNE